MPNDLAQLIERRNNAMAELAMRVLGPPWVSVCISTGEVFDAAPEQTELQRRFRALKARSRENEG